MSVKTNPSEELVDVLIAEDSRTQAEQLRHLLEQHHYRVTVAEDGKQALALLGEYTPALVITDIVMPEMNGFELCQRIKADERTQNIPVILLTSLSNSEDVLEGLASGADSFITKPYSEEYLLTNVRQILNNRQLRKGERVRIGVEILFAGKKRFITADQQQMLTLLISTYEAAVHRNTELIQTQDELSALNARLEGLVEERTADLVAEIIERKRAEEELRFSNTLLRTQQEASIDGILVVDESGTILSANGRFSELWGVPRELVGMCDDAPVLQLVTSKMAEPESFLQRVRYLYEHRNETSHEEIALKDGRTFDRYSAPIFGEDGQYYGRVWYFRDITDRKRFEDRERLARKVLELLNRSEKTSDIIGDILRLVKTSMDFEAVGIRLQEGDDYPYFEASGFSEDFLRDERYLCERNEAGEFVRDGTGSPVLECMCGNILCGRTNTALPFFTEGGSFWTNNTTQLLATTTEADRQARTCNRCNGEGYESVALIPLRSGGEIIGLLQLNDRRPNRFTLEQIHFFEGLGASIGIAVARKRAEESLRDSVLKYRSMVDNIGIGVSLISPDMHVLEMNRQMTAWFPEAARKDEPICYRVFNDPPEESVCHDCPTLAVLREGEVREATIQTLRGGKTRNHHIVASPVFDAQGNVTAIIAMVEDITDRRSLEQQLNQAQKMEAVGQLAGGVAHDFNNILQAMMGYSELLMERIPCEDEGHGFAKEIAEGAERAAALTRQLLAFSRRQVLQMDDLDLNSVIQGLMKMLTRVIGEDVQVDTVSGHRLGTVHADWGQMEQVLMNLCVNARDAMSEGGVVTIETENVLLNGEYCATHPWASPGRYVLLSVTDTGCGIDAIAMEHIFEPFFTTKALGKGTGLGLATVYGIVRQHQGMIQVYSEIDEGTSFKVYLPMVERAASKMGRKIKTRPRGGSETILLAEDDEMVRTLATRILENAGYTVLAAENGQEALRVFRESGQGIDLVLADVVMPKLGGKGIYNALRETNPSLRFLFSSGYSANAVHTGFVLHEGIELIQKPYAPDDLLRKVREVLDKTPE